MEFRNGEIAKKWSSTGRGEQLGKLFNDGTLPLQAGFNSNLRQ